MTKDKKFPVVVYNDKGLETYREEANGYWVKREYDEQGRQIYWETNRGGWARHQYDDAGNEISYENSDGFWFKAEFNVNGFRTFYEDSNEKILGRKNVDSLVSNAAERSRETDKNINNVELEHGL